MFKINRSVLIIVVAVLVVVQLLLLQPSRVEISENETQNIYPSIEVQVDAQNRKDDLKYTLKKVRYTLLEKGQKQWLINTDQSVVFDKSNLVVSDNVKMQTYDAQGKITVIEGDHSGFLMAGKSISIYGRVKVLFPDDFWIRTERVDYLSHIQQFSTNDPFYGESRRASGEQVFMWGNGFVGHKNSPEIYILDNSRVQMKQAGSKEMTDVRSDRSKVDREKKIGDFYMSAPERYVESNQGTLYIRSKKQNVMYSQETRDLYYMIATDDVMIQETDPIKGQNGMKYSTSQKAEFYTKQNKILLSGFPSVYQKTDTVTGELITVYRDKNIVEVTDANAYHEGEGTK